MHVDFVDGDYKKTIEAYGATVAVPQAYVVPGLSQTRDDMNAALSRNEGEGEPIRIDAQTTFRSLIECDKLLTAEELSIVEESDDASQLAAHIAQGRRTCVQVTKVHLKLAALLQQACGPYSEIFFDAALKRAEELDRRSEKAGRLFGVPISIKAHISMEGTGSDRGFVFDVLRPEAKRRLVDELEKRGQVEESIISLLRKQAEHLGSSNAPMVDKLLSEGAIIIAKTRMPQSVMQLDTRSNLHGQTLNPLNMNLSPGGSSGGEAASVCAGATFLGLGTDIGGSVRQPASCCGLYGIRPTVGRIAVAGINSTMPGNEGIIGTAGPFAKSRRDLGLMMAILASGSHSVDPFLCPPIPWQNTEDVELPKRKLKVGVMYHDGHVEPITPIRRTLAHVVEQLKADGRVEIVPFDAEDAGVVAWKLARELYFMESGQLIKSLATLTNEPLVPLTRYICETSPVKNHTAAQSWELQYARETFKRQFWRNYGSSSSSSSSPLGPDAKIDVLLCPAGAQIAPRPGKIWYWGYTSLFNLTDLPGVVFPVKSFVADSEADLEYEGREKGRTQSNEALDKQNREEYERNRAIFDGAPVGLQLVGHRFKEETLLKSLELIENAMKH